MSDIKRQLIVSDADRQLIADARAILDMLNHRLRPDGPEITKEEIRKRVNVAVVKLNAVVPRSTLRGTKRPPNVVIRDAMRHLNLRNRDVAAALGETYKSHISEIVTGKRPVPKAKLVPLSLLLGVPVRALIYGEA